MQTRAASTTLTDFVLRFVALIAVTLAVLASVAVSASKHDGRAAVAAPVVESAQDINSRRYPMVFDAPRDGAAPLHASR